MHLVTKPSFSTCYYIRGILLQNADKLKSTTSQATGLCVNCKEMLEKLLDTVVFLEETFEELLQKLYLEETEISAKVQQLETLSTCHQKVLNQKPINSQKLQEIEQEIFLILGFKWVVIIIEDLVIALNQLNQISNNYLGPTLTYNMWQSTRPQIAWLEDFQINRAAKITFAGTTTETVTLAQLQKIQEWVTAFINRVSQVIRDFSTTVEQKQIGELPGGVLLTQVNSYLSWVSAKTKLAHS